MRYKGAAVLVFTIFMTINSVGLADTIVSLNKSDIEKNNYLVEINHPDILLNITYILRKEGIWYTFAFGSKVGVYIKPENIHRFKEIMNVIYLQSMVRLALPDRIYEQSRKELDKAGVLYEIHCVSGVQFLGYHANNAFNVVKIITKLKGDRDEMLYETESRYCLESIDDESGTFSKFMTKIALQSTLKLALPDKIYEQSKDELDKVGVVYTVHCMSGIPFLAYDPKFDYKVAEIVTTLKGKLNAKFFETESQHCLSPPDHKRFDVFKGL